MIKHEKIEGERQIVEKTILYDEKGTEVVSKETSYGDVEIKRDLEAHQRQLAYWQGVDPKKYVDQKIAESQKAVDEYTARYEAMALPQAEWDKLEV